MQMKRYRLCYRPIQYIAQAENVFFLNTNVMLGYSYAIAVYQACVTNKIVFSLDFVGIGIA